MEQLFLREDLAEIWRGKDPFELAFALSGEVVRDVAQRQTLRVGIDGRSYFIKRHGGVGWAEIFKNLLVGKAPVLGAENEYRAVLDLTEAGVATLPVAGFGVRGRNPAARRSFLVTDDLSPSYSLEEICLTWIEDPPAPGTKHALIRRVAEMAQIMHGLGINHRDFYICHFLVCSDEGLTRENAEHVPIHLIDLHRAQIRSRVPWRWLVRDLGGLYFSTFDIGLTRRDVLRFLRSYFDAPLREVLREHTALLSQIERRAHQHYEKARRAGNLPRQVAGLRLNRDLP